MAKLTLTDISNTNSQTSIASNMNANNTRLENALELTLSRDGTSPNQMVADLDMNSNRIINLPEATQDSDPVRLEDLTNLITASDADLVYARAVRYDTDQTLTDEQKTTARVNIGIYDSSEKNIRDFLSAGVKNDFEVDLNAAINEDIEEWLSAGNRTLIIPPGIYTFTAGADGATVYPFALQDVENVSFLGAGSSVTTFKAGDETNLSASPAFRGVSHLVYRGITHDGNVAGMTDPQDNGSRHGFSMGEICHYVTIEDFCSLNANGYGMAFQGNIGDVLPASYRHFKLNNIYIENCMNDGIDVKNPHFADPDLVNFDWQVNNITVVNFAMRQDWDEREVDDIPVGDDNLWRNAEYAGIDIRSDWTHVNNATVIHRALHTITNNPITDVSGIRARSSGDSHHYHLSNFYIELSNNGLTDVALATIGLDLEGDYATVVGGHVENADRGIHITGEYCNVSNVTFNDTHHAIGSIGTTNLVSNITATNCSGNAIKTGTGGRFSNIKIDVAGDPAEGDWVYAEALGESTLNGVLWYDNDQITMPGVGIIAKADAAHTFAATDMGLTINCTRNGASTHTIPLNATVPISIGARVEIIQTGTGQVTIAPDTSVTLRAPDGAKTSSQYARVFLQKIATDTWLLSGDCTA